MMVLCFVGRSEQPPLPNSGGGGERRHTNPSTPVRGNPFLVVSERKLTHLSGLEDQDVDSQPGVS
ncbi:MAG TPA: hypothetical protein VFL79_21170, partial [Terriglobia bacterium]|nr:hypothetical protein [Terriglobia bacterium]